MTTLMQASNQWYRRPDDERYTSLIDMRDHFARIRDESRSFTHPTRRIHEAEEGRPIETLWDAATAATAYARGIPHQDKRVEIERTAGQLIKLAA